MNGRINTLLCGVGAALLMASMAEDAAARGTGDVARVKGKDGVWTEVPLVGVREADGGVRYTFPAAEARKAQVVQFGLGRAQAKAGEDGFWMGGRGVVGCFTREKMRWVNGAQFMDHPYFAMQTPRGAFIAIVEGMRFEFNVVVEAKDGRYRAYPSWDIERHAFGEAYEDLSLVVYDLGKGADWNAMAKAYRRRVLAREGAARRIETLKERAKARPHLLKMANAIALRRRHACKPYVFKDPKHDVDFTPETEKKPECLYSFAQTLAFLQRLKTLGVDDVALCVAGWQDGGYDGRCPSSFPVSPEAGGEARLPLCNILPISSRETMPWLIQWRCMTSASWKALVAVMLMPALAMSACQRRERLNPQWGRMARRSRSFGHLPPTWMTAGSSDCLSRTMSRASTSFLLRATMRRRAAIAPPPLASLVLMSRTFIGKPPSRAIY